MEFDSPMGLAWPARSTTGGIYEIQSSDKLKVENDTPLELNNNK